MLLRFTVSNFLSFAKETEFTTFPYERLRAHRDHVFDLDASKVLRTAAIYGGNGSGKSNFIRAAYVLWRAVTKAEIDWVGVKRFAMDESLADQPIAFEMEFKREETFFLYGLELADGYISNEWLYQTFPDKKDAEQLIFERQQTEGRIRVNIIDEYRQIDRQRSVLQMVETIGLPGGGSTPFLHFADGYRDFPLLSQATSWFEEDLLFLTPETGSYHRVELLLNEPQVLSYVNELLPKLDTGIVEIAIDRFSLTETLRLNATLRGRMEEAFREPLAGDRVALTLPGYLPMVVERKDGEYFAHVLVTKHPAKNGMVNFSVDRESDGTLRLLDLLPLLYGTLHESKVVFVDEIGRSVHPVVLRALLQRFLRTPARGQFIFTTHQLDLLDTDLFRQDEIWFVDKNQTGASELYALSDFKPRRDLDLQRGYRAGRYGGIPNTLDLAAEIWSDDA